jgi:hypothetical protein
MSMPKIEIENIRLDVALSNIVASIALEEAALSQILNAEGEKLQAVIQVEGNTVDDLVSINHAIQDLIEHVFAGEDALERKLNTVLETLVQLFGDEDN